MKVLIKYWVLLLFIISFEKYLSQNVVTVDNPSTANYFSNGAPSLSHTVGSGSDRILLVFITNAPKTASSDASGLSSVTYNSLPMTIIDSAVFRPKLKSYLYYMLNPASGTNTITVTLKNNQDYCALGSASFSNVTQSLPYYEKFGNNTTSATSIIPTPFQNDLLLGFCGTANNVTGVGTGTPSDQTTLFEAGSASKSYVNLSSKTSVSTTASFSISIASTAADWELINVRLTPKNAVSLPAKLSVYEVRCKDEFTSLNWTSKSEHNNDFFTIEKSEDAYDYISIATIEGNGTTNQEHHYIYTDEVNNEKPFYYRLKQTDFDGKSETFHPLLSNCFDAKEKIYFPNPVKDKIQLNSKSDFTHASIYSVDGKRIKESEIIKSTNYIDLRDFSSGMYFIQLSNSNKKSEFIKFIKE